MYYVLGYMVGLGKYEDLQVTTVSGGIEDQRNYAPYTLIAGPFTTEAKGWQWVEDHMLTSNEL